MTRDQMIDEAVRSAVPDTAKIVVLNNQLFGCPYVPEIRAEFRRIAERESWNARCDEIKSRYAHTYERSKQA